jgi:hypothetical protein
MTPRLAMPMVLALVATQALAQQSVPVLKYDPPANFYRSAITPPDDFTSNETKASVQVYPFRPFSGDIGRQFQQTLLRDWIDPRFREGNVAAQPAFSADPMPGAQTVLSARFVENGPGMARPHWRAVVIVGNLAALVDVSAAANESWQRVAPAVRAMLASMRVETAAAPPSVAGGPGPAGAAVAGLYMGYKAKYMPNLNRGVGYGDSKMSLHYYLFSADGRVYRAYDQLAVPGGDPSRFDFDAAQRNDPGNSGRYTVKDGKLYIQLGPAEQPETITAAAPQGKQLRINDILYTRQ